MKKNYFKKVAALASVFAIAAAMGSNANAQSGYALVLDGSTQYMSVPSHTDFDLAAGQSITITMWVKTPVSGGVGNGRTFSRMDGNNAGYEAFVGQTNAANLAGNVRTTQTPGTNIGVTAYPSPSPGLNTGAFRHIAVVISMDGVQKAMQLYVDGSPFGSNTAKAPASSTIVNSTTLFFGAKPNGTPVNFFKGEIDEIHVWSKALTQGEVQTDMVTPITGATPNVVAAWNFEGTSGSNVPDVTGNGHDGTLFGAPVLPLNFLSFNTSTKSNLIHFAWSTAQERNVSHFEAEYSKNGKDFTKAGTVTAQGGGNYTFDFSYGAAAGTVYTRVKAVDNDGTASYSDVETVQLANTAVFTVSPNPVADVLTVDNAIENGAATLTIANAQGTVVKSIRFTSSSVRVNVADLAAGVYVATLQAAGKTQVQKFIKQ
jgi:hypothetical protein